METKVGQPGNPGCRQNGGRFGLGAVVGGWKDRSFLPGLPRGQPPPRNRYISTNECSSLLSFALVQGCREKMRHGFARRRFAGSEGRQL